MKLQMLSVVVLWYRTTTERAEQWKNSLTKYNLLGLCLTVYKVRKISLKKDPHKNNINYFLEMFVKRNRVLQKRAYLKKLNQQSTKTSVQYCKHRDI